MPSLNAADCLALIEALTAIAVRRVTNHLGPGGHGPGAQQGRRLAGDRSRRSRRDCDLRGLGAAGASRADHLRGAGIAGKAARRIERGSYFLVDPLDGTREFIAGRDEYTVNIALLTDGVPLLGVIGAPARGDVARRRRPQCRATSPIDRLQAQSPHPRPAAPASRAGHHGQPFASSTREPRPMSSAFRRPSCCHAARR